MTTGTETVSFELLREIHQSKDVLLLVQNLESILHFNQNRRIAMDLDKLLAAAAALEITPEMTAAMEERLRITEDEFDVDRRLKEADPQGFLRIEYNM